MKKLVLFICLSFVSIGTLLSQEYSRAKIYADRAGMKQLAELGLPMDHGQRKEGFFIVSEFSKREIEIARNAGFKVDILIDDLLKYYQDRNAHPTTPTRNGQCTSGVFQTYKELEVTNHFKYGSMGGFFTYQEFLAELDLMATTYPNLISARAPISTFQTSEGRSLFMVRISDNPSTDETTEPEVLYTAVHHAREPMSMTALINYMWYLLDNYATSNEIKHLVNNTEMYFVPLVNPDGYCYNQSTNPNGGGFWRKNRRDNGSSYGVDPNRNYSHGWGTTGISFNPTSDVYPGTGAFSEPETQAIKWLCEQHQFKFAFNAHSHSDFILFPFGDLTDAFAEDHEYLLLVSSTMTRYNGFVAKKASSLYEASGGSDDYMYADDLDKKPEIFAYTPEIGSTEDGFWPEISRIKPLAIAMLRPNLMLSHCAHKYLDVRDNDPLNITASTGQLHVGLTRLGLVDGAIPVRIQPIKGFQTVSGIQNVTLLREEKVEKTFDYTLKSSVKLGDTLIYVIVADYTTWEYRDTIYKLFGMPTIRVSDPANTAVNWSGNWSTTTEAYFSPSSSFTDSPNTSYDVNGYSEFHYIPTIDLRKSTAAQIRFRAKWDIEQQYDYVQFFVRPKGGSPIPQCGKYTIISGTVNGTVQPLDEPIYEGLQADWVLEEINLSDYLGQEIEVYFVLQSDGGTQNDGFYFDDFEVFYDEQVGLEELSTISMSIFPNPAQDQVTVAFDKSVSNGEIAIYSMEGKLIRVQKLITGSKESTLSIGDLPVGRYEIRLNENGTLVGQPKPLVVVR